MFSSSSLVSLSSLALMMCFTNVISFSVPPRTFVVSRGFNQPLYMAQGEEGGEKKGFFANFFEELDNFIDDATSRRLGAGQAFYGKRKSSFYGAEDTGKKKDNSKFDPTEDYYGPSSAGYFKWVQDEDGRVVPVTRLKEKNIESRK